MREREGGDGRTHLFCTSDIQPLKYTLRYTRLIALSDPKRDIAMILCLAPSPRHETRGYEPARGVSARHDEF